MDTTEEVAQPYFSSSNHPTFTGSASQPEPSGARYESLFDLSRAIASLKLDALSHDLTSILQPIFRCDFANIALLRRGEKLTCWHSFGADELIRLDDFPEQSTLWFAYQEEKPVWVSDWHTDERGSVHKEAVAAGFVYRSLCRFPMRTQQGCIGVLSLATVAPYRYSDSEIRFLSMAAAQMAIGIESVLHQAKLQNLKNEPEEEEELLLGTRKFSFEEIVGKSSSLENVLRHVEVVAPTDSSVLIQGETGTGKELIARAIHKRSPRSAHPFIKVNCAAIPSGLVESELFGHEKGAFTGAVMRRVGRFELANKGTLFLDEVGDIPLELQAKLLRVLQEREFERLGSIHTQQVDVRVIAATHRNLREMIKEGKFRSDLYYRLNVFPVTIPPLRERSDDIPLIVHHFVSKFAKRMNRRIETIPRRAMQVFAAHSWPGNVRELQNFIERAVILSPGNSLRAPLEQLKEEMPSESHSSLGTLEEMEREHVLRALRESNWVAGGPGGAAAKLGIKRTTLAYRIRKLKIPLRPT